MTGDKVISALIGLVGAVSNNGRTEQTDEVIREAFLHLREPDRDEDMVRQIHTVKNVIAPDCAVCKNPCGNTSDYDMTQFYGADEKVVGAKQKLIETICGVMKESGEMTDSVYRGIAYLGYSVQPEECEELQQEIQEVYK